MAKDKDFQRAYDEVKDLVEAIRGVHRIALIQYTPLVDDVLSGKIADEASIERIMDGLLSFCDSQECMTLFKRLCRHIFYKHPQMVKDYISCYRMLYEEQPERKTQ